VVNEGGNSVSLGNGNQTSGIHDLFSTLETADRDVLLFELNA